MWLFFSGSLVFPNNLKGGMLIQFECELWNQDCLGSALSGTTQNEGNAYFMMWE